MLLKMRFLLKIQKLRDTDLIYNELRTSFLIMLDNVNYCYTHHRSIIKNFIYILIIKDIKG